VVENTLFIVVLMIDTLFTLAVIGGAILFSLVSPEPKLYLLISPLCLG
jgi:hypothetical protein